MDIQSDGTSASLTEAQFDVISDLFFSKAGIRLPKSKILTAQSRLKPRIQAMGLSTFDEYIRILRDRSNESEHAKFCNALTTNTTSFFREKHHFERLEEFLSEASKRKDVETVNIWSAGCSTGQEPYSIALKILENSKLEGTLNVRVLATDLNSDVLAKAKEGRYSIDQIEGIPNKVQKHLIIENDYFCFRDEVKNLIHFKSLNLFEKWPLSTHFDIIFCRNVMIYFTPSKSTELCKKFAGLMKPNALIFFGHSESSLTVANGLTPDGPTTFRRLP